MATAAPALTPTPDSPDVYYLVPPPIGMKFCATCRTSKPQEEYYRGKRGKAAGRLNPRCKQCCSSIAGAWFRNNRERHNAKQREYNANNKATVRLHRVKSIYGLSKEAYAAMAKVCAVCGGTKGQLCIDHSHQSGRVRGILCGQCNKGMGQFRDKPSLLLSAVRYLLAASAAEVKA